MNTAQPLSNVRVLVTRPKHQARRFIAAISQLGGLAFHLPTIEIVFPLHNPPQLDADLIIFTSVNSVIGAQPTSKTVGNNNTPLVAAIGNATANALGDRGFKDIIAPENSSNSESLLLLLEPYIFPSIKVIIVRGDSGRDVLRDGLIKLRAQVRYEEVYHRTLPNQSSEAPSPGSRWQQADPSIVSVSSDQGLINLIALLPEKFHPQLFTKPLIVNSKRCLQMAVAEGFTSEIYVANPPGDRGQIDQLTAYAESNY